MNSEREKLGSILRELEEDSNLNYEKTAKLMRIAIKIDNALKAKGISRQEFAQRLGKQRSVVTKWLSGTHNFTAETLVEIESALAIRLIEDADNVYSITSSHYKRSKVNNRWHEVDVASTLGLALC